MSRARATALTLVNWKGVFFEHYWLDRHVTALEGANGAGKTTVMIAAYVVLLPDLTRLRFVNLGETGPSGGDKGIWGRLGDAGPSYAALDVDPGDGQRVSLGVHLERKAAPSLALTPFVISGLAPTDSIQRFFLDSVLDQGSTHEQVSSLSEIERKVKEAGFGIEIFGSSKDYFTHLFERGINPLRLGTDEERNKWNEMLRTSMTGGISRTLTSDLRSFLFKQESGLSDTLSRMHKNLEACRRTRIEVSEARVLEHELSSVCAAGQSMFRAVLEASREQAREGRERRQRAEQRYATELAKKLEQQTRRAEAELLQQGLTPRLERARVAEQQAKERVATLEKSLALAARAAELDAERARLEPEALLAADQKAAASAARKRAKGERDGAQQTLLRAATGLGSLQSGLEELHRQAHAYRRLQNELERARSELTQFLSAATGAISAEARETELGQVLGILEQHQVAPEESASRGAHWTAQTKSAVQRALHEIDRARAERDRSRALFERRRAAEVRARAALASLCGAVAEGDLRARAELELARLRELELISQRLPELQGDWQRRRTLAARQCAVRTELEALGLGGVGTATDFIAHFSALEADLKSSEQARREHELAARQALADAELLGAKKLALEARCDVYDHVARAASLLCHRGLEPPKTRIELASALRANDEARQVLASRAAELSRDSHHLSQRALECEAPLGGLDRQIAELAELCDGQPLAARYDDLDVEAARRKQAELGPLISAIVVDDPVRAAQQILPNADGARDVWLVRAGAELPWAATAELPAPNSGDTQHGSASKAHAHVVVDVGYGLRLSPLPVAVSLGRAARRRQADALRAEAEAAMSASAELTAREREERVARRELEVLQEHWDVWCLQDPRTELGELEKERSALRVKGAEAAELARARRLEATRLEVQRDGIKAQLAHHHLLDPPDYSEEARAARAALERAEGAAGELDRAREARATLISQIHDLEIAADVHVADARERGGATLDAQRDWLFSLADALELIEANGPAWVWAHAERAVAERSALVPELEAQHQRAELDLTRAQLELDAAERAWEAATERAQIASAALAALMAHVTRARDELRAHGISDPTALALEDARLEHERQAAVSADLRRTESGIEAELALAGERSNEAEKVANRAERELEIERSAELPATRQWQALALAAREVGEVVPEFSRAREPEPETALAGNVSEPAPRAISSAQRWLEARSQCELLGDRLGRARGGAELGEALSAALLRSEPSASETRGIEYVQLWRALQSWLQRRLPAPLSDLGDSLVGLSRLETDLSELERRLERQEGELRGTSGDVARSIDVQLRRANAQVRRLNRSLDGIKFGSIHAIRVQMDRVEKMDRVLAALRDGQTQELLFQANLPIEAALDEIFRRHAGGRSGGQRLLDFREYLELSVQIQRRPDQNWERVSASQVSTGEAIGIGAALMMVILTEWEREDHLLRRARDNGSLRFLFLDEANRLSQDNLGVLFDLCQTLDLQLLIAAPEVARAEGNTTYRLVRRVSDDGREEVLVTGRRTTPPEIFDTSRPGTPKPDPSDAVARAHEPARAEQVSLFGE